jgi:hypothetical protein
VECHECVLLREHPASLALLTQLSVSPQGITVLLALVIIVKTLSRHSLILGPSQYGNSILPMYQSWISPMSVLYQSYINVILATANIRRAFELYSIFGKCEVGFLLPHLYQPSSPIDILVIWNDEFRMTNDECGNSIIDFTWSAWV